MDSRPAIDFHAHAFPDSLAGAAMEKLSQSSGIVPRSDGTVSGLLRSMDGAGVSISVVHSIATSPRQFDAIRLWAADIRSPRIIPFPSVHPDSPDLPGELDRLADEGFRGVKLHPEYQEFLVDEKRMEGAYRRCSDRGLIVFFHAGDDISFPSSDRAAPRRLLAVKEAFPELVMVAAHAGGWRRWEEVAADLLGRDIYLDTSYTRGYLPDDFLRDLLLGHRADRLLFGSDTPWDDQGEARRHIEQLGLPEELLEMLMYRNAEDLLAAHGALA